MSALSSLSIIYWIDWLITSRVLQLLAQTQSAAEGPRKQAELQLKGLQSNEGENPTVARAFSA